ncbi:MAG: ComF family protein, partial [Gammaproteobacteria bacterium]|nr:ComF family protein [Gammaproteobacteria bacterium]
HGDQRPARVFGALLAATVALRRRAVGGEVAALVPVPLHTARHAERGFNQAESIARQAGLWLGVPVRAQGLSRVRATRPQTGLSGAERRRNLAAAFTATPVPRGTARGVALIDDVLTTGATVAAARTALLAAGVPSVQVWTVARAQPRRDAAGAAPQAARSA